MSTKAKAKSMKKTTLHKGQDYEFLNLGKMLNFRLGMTLRKDRANQTVC